VEFGLWRILLKLALEIRCSMAQRSGAVGLRVGGYREPHGLNCLEQVQHTACNPRVQPMTISCLDADWKTCAKSILAAKREVDLTNFNYSFDAEICVKLAKQHGMDFGFDPKTGSGFSRKRTTTD
jgi:hypothetical protein